MTLKTSQQNQGKSILTKVSLFQRDENIHVVAKGEIAQYKQFIRLPQYFYKSSHVKCFRIRLQVGKG